MIYKGLLGVFTKILIVLSLYVCAQNPTSRGTFLEICQFTLKKGAEYWNVFSKYWNTDQGKENILASLDQNPFYQQALVHQKEEIEFIRKTANEIQFMPEIEMSEDRLILKAPLSGETIIEVNNLDKIEDF